MFKKRVVKNKKRYDRKKVVDPSHMESV